MNFTPLTKVDKSTISQLINSAKVAEMSVDLKLSQEIFRPIWENIEFEPDFSEYDERQRAELFRLGGFC